MSRRYAPDHKTLVLKILKDFKGNIFATALYTGIPARTLREWLREQREKTAAASRTATTASETMPEQQ